ncbi:flagellar filament capping protein FliD [Anaerospora hongkongensis]|uniref:flagellar filament capping protein FliD n=1 Tax=Anaerospora hongkongensis TaxID=244830 RepID=UPI00289E8B3D|nr:flagellar filament capping protein FliD [Anaerospora hongkongensis]
MVMRTYGLSGSGMDVDQLVKDLMKARRASYDKVWQKKTQVEWKKQDVNTIYTLAEDLRNKTISDFKKQTTLSPKQVTSTNETIASATANADAANVSHSLIVQQLADGVKLSSSGSITDTASGKTKGTLADQFDGITATSEFNLTINGKTVAVKGSMTLNEVVSSINKAGADVKANYDTTLDRFYLYSNKTGSEAVVNFSGTDSAGLDFLFKNLKIGNSNTNLNSLGMTSKKADNGSISSDSVGDAFGITGSFNVTIKKTDADGTVTPYTVAVNSSDSIDTMLNDLNDKLGAGSASFDTVTGRITIKSSDINNGWSIEGLDQFGMNQLVQNGQDAIINLDGVALRQNSNTFTVSGVTYTLKATSFIDSVTNNPIPTNIGVQPDIDKTIANVQSFVDSYNTFMALVQKELKEDKYSDFAPLTDAQKADMKDSEIKAWEEKAKSGSLRRDPILTQMATNLRMSFTEPIKGLTGKYQSAIDIGIGTGKYFDDNGNITTEFANGGKIYVTESDLRKALEADPDIVFKIFGTPGDTQSTEGVANRLYDQMQESLNRLKTEAGTPNVTDTTSNMAKSIASYKDQLYDMNSRLAQVEARYYKQFDAMEKALSNLSKQSSWLSQQLGQ